MHRHPNRLPSTWCLHFESNHLPVLQSSRSKLIINAIVNNLHINPVTWDRSVGEMSMQWCNNDKFGFSCQKKRNFISYPSTSSGHQRHSSVALHKLSWLLEWRESQSTERQKATTEPAKSKTKLINPSKWCFWGVRGYELILIPAQIGAVVILCNEILQRPVASIIEPAPQLLLLCLCNFSLIGPYCRIQQPPNLCSVKNVTRYGRVLLYTVSQTCLFLQLHWRMRKSMSSMSTGPFIDQT